MRVLAASTGQWVMVGPVINYSDGTPAESVSVEQVDVFRVTGNSRTNIHLTSNWMMVDRGIAKIWIANLTPTGDLRIEITNAEVGGVPTNVIVPFVEDFHVVSAENYAQVYGSGLQQVNLAATGLDAISNDEPSGDPSTWNFREWFIWLIKRFAGKRTQGTSDGLVVYNSAGTPITKQARSFNGTEETSAAVEACE